MPHGAVNTTHDEPRWVGKWNRIVVHLLEALPDDRIRMHVARSIHCSELPQLRDCHIVESKFLYQYVNPVIDVRMPTVQA